MPAKEKQPSTPFQPRQDRKLMTKEDKQRDKAFKTGIRIVLSQVIAELIKDKSDPNLALTQMFEPLIAGTESVRPRNPLEKIADEEFKDLFSRIENNVRCHIDLPNADPSRLP